MKKIIKVNKPVSKVNPLEMDFIRTTSKKPRIEEIKKKMNENKQKLLSDDIFTIKETEPTKKVFTDFKKLDCVIQKKTRATDVNTYNTRAADVTTKKTRADVTTQKTKNKKKKKIINIISIIKM